MNASINRRNGLMNQTARLSKLQTESNFANFIATLSPNNIKTQDNQSQSLDNNNNNNFCYSYYPFNNNLKTFYKELTPQIKTPIDIQIFGQKNMLRQSTVDSPKKMKIHRLSSEKNKMIHFTRRKESLPDPNKNQMTHQINGSNK